MAGTRRYVGTTHDMEVASGREAVTGHDVELREDGGEYRITSTVEPERVRIASLTAAEARVLQKIKTMEEQEDLRARRMRGDFAFFKQERTPPPPPHPSTCKNCGRSGWVTDADGCYQPCPVCGGWED